MAEHVAAGSNALLGDRRGTSKPISSATPHKNHDDLRGVKTEHTANYDGIDGRCFEERWRNKKRGDKCNVTHCGKQEALCEAMRRGDLRNCETSDCAKRQPHEKVTREQHDRKMSVTRTRPTQLP